MAYRYGNTHGVVERRLLLLHNRSPRMHKKCDSLVVPIGEFGKTRRLNGQSNPAVRTVQ
jgi:hypothetical protein